MSKIAAMLQKATERATPELPATAGSQSGRFARDPGEFAMAGGATQLTLIPGGLAVATESTTAATKKETTS